MGLFFEGLFKFLSIFSEFMYTYRIAYDYALFLYTEEANYNNYMAFNSVKYSAV